MFLHSFLFDFLFILYMCDIFGLVVRFRQGTYSTAVQLQLGFTRGVTGALARSLRNLELEAEELQSLADSSGN